MVEFKNLKGKVITSFSCTSKIEQLCAHYGLLHSTSKIGFKYICKEMIESESLLGGEESGGIAVSTHIPERDGIWMGLIIWEYLVKTGKDLATLTEEMYKLVGSFAMDRYDLHVTEELKSKIVHNCLSRNYSNFGDLKITHIEDLDGYKFHLGNDEWVMIRPSGTEPVLRVYAQSANKDRTIAILDATKKAILD